MIVEARKLVADKLREFKRPVLDYLPEDMGVVPCVVVGRPSIGPSIAEGADFDIAVPVAVVGRPIRDKDAQVQLDELADETIARFIDSYPFTVAPSTESVANVTYPAYLLTITVPVKVC